MILLSNESKHLPEPFAHSPQDAMPPTLTVRDTLLFAYRCNSENADKDHVDTILGVLGLSHDQGPVRKGVRGPENPPLSILSLSRFVVFVPLFLF